MSDNVAARLRQKLIGGGDTYLSSSTVPVFRSDLAALLDVVERFAASSPVADDADDTMPTCRYCGDKAYSDPDGVYGWDHADDCPWLAARRLCGLEVR